MQKRFLLAVALMWMTGVVQAQQFTSLSQYMLNSAYLNPAYSGTGERYNFTVLHRTQWAGYRDYQGEATASQMQVFTGFANIDNTGHTIGLMMARDKIAYQTDFLIQASYAYRVRLSNESTLSLGARAGIDSRTVDFQRYVVYDPNDPLIPEAKQSKTQPDISLGMWYHHDVFYLGAAARSIVGTSDADPGFNRAPAFILTGGLPLHVSNTFTVTPSAQIIVSAGDPAFDISALASYDDLVWGGLSYRHGQAASLIAGIALLQRKLHFTYDFDYATKNASTTASSSHEFSLQYRVGKRKEGRGKFVLHQPKLKVTNIVRDRDDDGVADDEDECVNIAGVKKLKGCPDSDSDGVADPKDKCPDVAGEEALDGCPDKDNDGTADHEDACPEMAGPQALNGCPDADKDGVADKDDQCPEVPGIPAHNGCPESLSRESLGHVTFETGQATLETSSYRYLDEVIVVLKRYDDTQLVIEGHTDSEGDDAMNLELSKQRAETIRAYFIQKGIRAERMSTIGYGETRPVDTNDTVSGRQRNRRVQIRFVDVRRP